MTGTFGSLNIAKTGLQYQQVVIDTTNNNIANVNTDGYVRRRANGAEVGGATTGAMWSTYTGHGEGVTTTSVSRLTDFLMDARVRTEHANLSYLQVQQTSMERVETAIDEPSDTGVASALSAFGSSWQDVVSSPDGSAARQSVVASGQTLAAAINAQARAVDNERAQQRAAAVDDVSTINNDAQQLAQLNHNIFIAQANGTDVSDLQDQRDQIALDLANKAGAVVTQDSTGRYSVSINGVALVAGDNAGTLSVNGINADGTPANGDTANPDAVSFSISDPVPVGAAPSTNQTAVPSGMGGELGGIATLLNVTLATYRAGLNTVAQQLADMVNTQHEAGYDQTGAAGGAFFGYTAGDAAGTIAVAISDPSQVAASADGSGQSNNADNADAITQVLNGAIGAGSPPGTPVNINDAYQRLVTGLGSTVAGLNTQTTNQQLLASQVDDEREQQAGVSLDEETINLMQAQRAYEASSRVLTVMNSLLDTLINRMGV
jgi:flagellar hook-associated protein 1 FlgK